MTKASGCRWSIAGHALVAITLGLAACGGKRPPTPDYPPLPSVARDASAVESPVEISLFRVTYRFEDDGRYRRTLEDRYRILDESAVESWGSTEAHWSPWHMKRPVIAATVTSASGTKTSLDPATIAESSAYPNAPDLYGDERLLRAPLPNLGPGAVVDETITYEASRPWVGGGEVHTMLIQQGIARKRVELVVDLPEKMPFRYEQRDTSIAAKDESKSGRRVLTFAGGPYPAVKPLEPSAPSDVAEWPSIAFTTNTAWKPLAAEYARLVDEKLASANLEGVVEKIVQPSDSPSAKATKLTAWVRARVRYVAVEFGDSSVVPRTPDGTLKHGYGDCKDQAVLLVGLLRAAGVKASVALLRAGFGEDVIPSLPGLNVFNHAIVHVDDATPFWIDPTATHARPGELPTPDQGRWSLIVDRGTDALTRTPHGEHGDNTYHETRQLFLAEYGASRVVETSRATGAIERSLREEYDADATAITKWHKSYVLRTYSSDVPGALEVSDPKDLSKPFSMKVEAKKSRYAVTGLVETSTSLDPGVALSFVPGSLAFGAERKTDYALRMPHESTVVFELRPPAGFSVDKKPEPSDVTLGPASFRQSVEVRPDGSVAVTMKLSLPKARWTPADVAAFRKAYTALLAAKRPTVTFVHEAERLHRARAYDQELAAYRAALAKEPAAPLAKLRLAVALLELGFGGPARKLADEVAKSEPTVADYWDNIGFIRGSDRLGRANRAGWDQAGAIAAYRKALELDAGDLYAAVNLATTLEYDEAGERYAPGAKLDEAVAAFDRIPAEKLDSYQDGRFVANALYDLMWAGRFEKVRDRAKTIDRANLAEVPVIVSAAMLGGANAGLAEANRLAIPETRRSATLVSAGDALVQLRRYAEAAALLGAAAATSSDPQLRSRVSIISKAKPVDVQALPAVKPVEAALKATLLCILGDPTISDQVAPLMSPALVPKKGETRAAVLCGSAGPKSPRASRLAVTDLIAAMLEPKVDGSDDLGFRVALRTPTGTFHLFVQTEGKSARVRAVEEHPSELGCAALTLSKAGRTAAATQWLTWAKELLTPASGDDPLREAPFVRLWSDKKDDLELAAAALCAQGGHPDVSVPVLTAARKGAKGDRAQILAHAITLAYADGDHDAELLSHASQLSKELPSSYKAWHLHRLALRKLGRFKELRDLAAARAAKDPNDAAKIEELATAEDLLGHSKEARAAGDKLLATGKGGAVAYNNQAWRCLFGGGVGKIEIGWALQAVTMAPNDRGYLNTLAALDADAGHVADGLEQFQKSVAGVDEAERGGADWFVYARLAEQLGLADEARAAYAKITPSGREYGEHTVFKLAERRLKVLKL
ncbi:MAG: DUF3857 domain-containing protein [Deltaproteobacteria bacterium]|nr:DUF3857 domain-containing protein [Deltaproteobacteria bacterium]